MSILYDPIWQFIGVVVGIIALICSIVIPIWLRNRKELSYQVLPAVENSKYIPGKLVTILRFMNSGNDSIALDDYQSPIKITFPPEVEIVSTTLGETDPANLPVVVEAQGSIATINPIMLNPEDTFYILFELSKEASPKVEGRIIGIRKIRNNLMVKNTLIVLFVVAALVNGITLYVGIVYDLPQYSLDWWGWVVTAGLSRLVSIGVTIPIIIEGWKDFSRRERLTKNASP